ncbi:MAG: NAD(P)(+) transhydrogenase (Re/Si-specific) subunit beta, partial [Pseudomonadota bacterium]|nr:NAD(P)(+) transhydrogenase (Re/Si-specific) subunit beta [Pseudomonadota bacterium]
MEILQSEIFANLSYILASMLFIFGLKQLGSPETAQRGNLISSSGMLLAVLVTLVNNQIISYEWLAIGLTLGILVGATAASLVKMTSMPELVALFNGFGGIASLLVGSAEYLGTGGLGLISLTAIFLTLIIGGVTFSGSLIAYGKLSEILPGRQITFKGQRIVLIVVFLVALFLGGHLIFDFSLSGWSSLYTFLLLISFALVIGLLITLPIGGADMPVIIALLNSYSGLAASAAGFVINNNVLIVAGALVGASGLILTNIMCKAMNRSLANVVFGSIASASSSNINAEDVGEIKPINISDAYLILEAANSVLVVPGYGMAVSQAQHAVRELGELLEENGCEVNYA